MILSDNNIDKVFIRNTLWLKLKLSKSRALKFPGNFPGKPENFGKIPVSREYKNPGKSTPLDVPSNTD